MLNQEKQLVSISIRVKRIEDLLRNAKRLRKNAETKTENREKTVEYDSIRKK